MPITRKHLLLAVVAAGLVALAVYEHRMRVSAERNLSQAASEMTRLSDGVTRSGESQTTPAGLGSAAVNAGVPMPVIAADVLAKDTSLLGVNTASVRTRARDVRGLPSTAVTPALSESTVRQAPTLSEGACKYARTVEHLALYDDFGSVKTPWGSVSFSASEEFPWGYKALPKALRLSTVIARQGSGAHTVYSYLSMDVGGQRYALPIQEARWVETAPANAWRWSTKAYIGLGGGVRFDTERMLVLGGAVSLSLASYGQTATAPTWALGLVGVGLTSAAAPAVVLTPFIWNVSDFIPIVDTLFIGPSYFLDSAGTSSGLLTLSAKL